MIGSLRPALTLLALMTFLLGGIYPAAVWSVGQLAFADKAAGEPVTREGQTIGYAQIGQNFGQDTYFWPRPSAAQGGPYSFIGAGPSNLSAANPRWLGEVARRAKHMRELHPEASERSPLLPPDIVTASGSGLDPHISPQAAQFQAERIAAARNIPLATVGSLITQHIEEPTFGFIGQPRVNVLRLNLALDEIKGAAHDR